MDPFRNGAAGVVSSAKLFRPEDFAELTTITASRYRARASRPSAALSVASHLLVDASATPSLRGGEYSTFNISSIDSHRHRPPLQFLPRPLLMQPGLVGCFLRVGRILHAGNGPSAVRSSGKVEGDGSK